MNKAELLEEICMSAARHTQPNVPEGLDLNDLKLHTCLDRLYENYERGALPLESCKALKQKLVAAWESDKATYDRYEQTVKEWNDKIMQANKTGIELHKMQNLRDFAVSAAKLVELLTGDIGLCQLASELPEVGF